MNNYSYMVEEACRKVVAAVETRIIDCAEALGDSVLTSIIKLGQHGKSSNFLSGERILGVIAIGEIVIFLLNILTRVNILGHSIFSRR